MKNCLLAVSFLMLSSFQVAVTSVTNLHVMKAAEGQLSIYTSRIQPGDASKYGFRQEDDMELLTIEKPYRVILFNSDFYESAPQEGKNYLNITNEWKVPVASKGMNRTLLTVQGISSNYKVMGMGDTTLARELQPVSKGLNDSDEYYILRIPMISADFFVHEPNNSFADAEFIPLFSATSAIKSISKSFNNSYSLDEIQTMVRNELTARAKKAEEQAEKNTTTKKSAPAKRQPKKATPAKPPVKQ